MRRVMIFLSLAILAISCAVVQPQQQKELVTFLDYRPYTEAGFFISPYNYTGKYEAIGQLDIVIVPEQVTEGMYLVKKEISSTDLLDKAVKHSLGKGANGIANLKITRVTAASALSHYELSGFLIRITE